MNVSQWATDLKLASADLDRLEGLLRSGSTPQKLVRCERGVFFRLLDLSRN